MRKIKGHGGAVPAPPDFPAPQRINALTDLPIGELRQAWAEAWGTPPPKGARRRLLVLGIAWKWQAAIHGGLPKPLERRLASLEAGHLRGGALDGAASTRASPRLMPGARLIRVWKGERHEVQVTETGYLWRGQGWKSLSAIAGAITGCPRNGPAFFGRRAGNAG
jgi:Protein of unknown function (DUF2924)